MTNFFKRFAQDESGAVTVDWVVLTAAIVGLGIAVLATVSGGLKSVAGNISTDMAGQLNGTDVSKNNGGSAYSDTTN